MTAASGLWAAQNQISFPKTDYALLLPGCTHPENFITHNALQEQLHKSHIHLNQRIAPLINQPHTLPIKALCS